MRIFSEKRNRCQKQEHVQDINASTYIVKHDKDSHKKRREDKQKTFKLTIHSLHMHNIAENLSSIQLNSSPSKIGILYEKKFLVLF